MKAPKDLRFSQEHEWLLAEGETARVGLSEPAAEALGDIVYVQLPSVGDTVAAGDVCGEIESTKSVSDLYAPVSGEVVGVNDAVMNDPALINRDPYGEGWLFKVRPTDDPALMSAAEYDVFVAADADTAS